MNIDYTTTGTTSSDFHFRPPSPDGQEIFRRPTFDSSDLSTTSNFRTSSSVKYPQNTRKKRTKMLRLDTTNNSVSTISKSKNYGKKPDPTAPKITRPCSECGKKFWSWKALFGHMRCHPERQWRGINPPPNFKKLEYGAGSDHSYGEDPTTRMTDEDRHVATCLLMLANGPTASCDQTPAVITSAGATTAPVGLTDSETGGVSGFGDSDGSVRFECSGCNKVFGSHQALGGHRASHKNVKGCFTITKSEGEDEVAVQEGGGGNQFVVVDNERNVGDGIRNLFGGSDGVGGDDHHEGISNSVHQCGICFRVFSSGQALGGHKRCHIWEKLGDEHTANAGGSSLFTQGLNVGSFALAYCGMDLNMPAAAAPYEDSSSASYTSCLALDLRLGL